MYKPIINNNKKSLLWQFQNKLSRFVVQTTLEIVDILFPNLTFKWAILLLTLICGIFWINLYLIFV
jgi:hypothetical protein